MSSTARDIVEADTLASAHRELAAGLFDLVLLDIGLPDGSGVDLAVAASKSLPAPLIVVISGEATGQDGFGLAKLGAVEFVRKPFSVDELLRAVERLSVSDLRYEAIVKTVVGRHDLRGVQERVRNTMVREALAITEGNKSQAAKLLRVTRQGLQQIVLRGRRRTREK